MTLPLLEARPALRSLRDRFRDQPPTEAEVRALAEEWRWAAVEAETEVLAVCTLDGEPTGVLAPRWLAHLTGMPHCTAHVGLATPGGFVILQRRSPAKAQFPDCWDMAVTGHVSFAADTQVERVCYREAAARELEEEMGLPLGEQDRLLQAPGLVPIGRPVAYFGEREEGGRPWYDVEVRQLFGAVLTPEGLVRLSYPESEISSVLLCRPAEAQRLAASPDTAAGAAASVREFAAWLSHRLP